MCKIKDSYENIIFPTLRSVTAERVIIPATFAVNRKTASYFFKRSNYHRYQSPNQHR